MILVRVEREELYNVQRTLNATNAQVERAGTRAMNKTLRWIGSQAKHQIAQQHDIPLKSLKGRVRLAKAKPGKARAIAWFGVSDMRAIFAGAKQNARGVHARGHFFQSAFIATPYGHLNVFKRKGRERFPIIVQKIPLDKAESILSEITTRVPDRLRTIYAQEINYEVNVRGF